MNIINALVATLAFCSLTATAQSRSESVDSNEPSAFTTSNSIQSSGLDGTYYSVEGAFVQRKAESFDNFCKRAQKTLNANPQKDESYRPLSARIEGTSLFVDDCKIEQKFDYISRTTVSHDGMSFDQAIKVNNNISKQIQDCSNKKGNRFAETLGFPKGVSYIKRCSGMLFIFMLRLNGKPDGDAVFTVLKPDAAI